MNELPYNSEFTRMIDHLNKEGMNRRLYIKISEDFGQLLHFPPKCILEILTHYLNYKGKHIYVNEIRNYLKNYSKELFMKYAQIFKNCRGCYEVFGIKEENVTTPSFLMEEVNTEPAKEKEYGNHRNKNSRKVKRNAKRLAVEQFKAKADSKKEKAAKNEEIRRLIRKQDI